MKEPIRKIELKDGTVRYRLVVDIGRDENGKRQQITRTFDKLKEARAELSRVRHETDRGTYVKPSEITVSEYLDEYLVGATRGRRESTKVSYRDWYTAGDEYVVTDELGVALHPEAYSDEFTRLLRRAGLPKIRLHDSRHTTLSLMEKAGVPISIVSKWAGHYDAAFTMKTYVHASDEDLRQRTKTLARIHKIA